MTPAEALEILASHLRHGVQIPEDARKVLAEGIEAYLADPRNAQLDRALGLRTRGGVSPGRAKMLAERDILLRRLWKVAGPWRDLDPAAAARLMTLSASRYVTTRWPRENDALSAPSAEPAATWWRIMRAGAPIPSAERVAQILREIQ